MTALGLGTVLFGTDYAGRRRCAEADVAEILACAAQCGVSVIDTAAQYGQAESVLGRALPAKHAFHIVSKTPSWNRRESSGASPARWALEAAGRAIERLRVDRLHGYLTHHAGELLGADGPALIEGLLEAKGRGLVGKIGVSVYDGEQIDRVLERFQIDLIQLPASAFDQRLVRSGHIARLRARGVEVHLRSLFLQGVLLAPPETIPEPLAALRPIVSRFQSDACRTGHGPLEAALGFARATGADAAVIGVASAGELRRAAAAFARPAPALDYAGYAVDDPALINPARWPKDVA